RQPDRQRRKARHRISAPDLPECHKHPRILAIPFPHFNSRHGAGSRDQIAELESRAFSRILNL
ncbi:MAG: hypothetical protein KDM91_23155, partial [Verrucomicrobiae bacterium]|nr:hypothetical protein [Verrucomicrobiae bacterium]